MSQRQLRPGDVLDDYCPRERRITNHVVVALIDDGVIKQTRCTTCDAEHPYKEGRAPARRKKPEAAGALVTPPAVRDVRTSVVRAARPDSAQTDEPGAADAEAPPPAFAEAVIRRLTPAPQPPPPPAPPAAPAHEAVNGRGDEEGPVHRRLIRATLPKIEGQAPPPRPAPTFTMRQNGGRQDGFWRGPRDPQQQQRRGGPHASPQHGGGFRQGGFQGQGQPGPQGPRKGPKGGGPHAAKAAGGRRDPRAGFHGQDNHPPRHARQDNKKRPR